MVLGFIVLGFKDRGRFRDGVESTRDLRCSCASKVGARVLPFPKYEAATIKECVAPKPFLCKT